jgi:hypothetical protein
LTNGLLSIRIEVDMKEQKPLKLLFEEIYDLLQQNKEHLVYESGKLVLTKESGKLIIEFKPSASNIKVDVYRRKEPWTYAKVNELNATFDLDQGLLYTYIYETYENLKAQYDYRDQQWRASKLSDLLSEF